MAVKICNLCKEKIDEKGHYAILEDHNLGKLISTGYYHAECYRRRFIKTQELESKTQELLNKANLVLGRLA